MISSVKTICVALAVLYSTCHRCLGDTDFVLQGRSFKIRSEITRIKPSNIIRSNSTVHLTEFYSYGQRRAKLHYDSPAFGTNINFYYDEKTGASFKYYSGACYSYPVENLNSELILHSEAKELLAALLRDNYDKYLIGPSRLLFYIVAQADKLRLNDSDDLKIRNVPVVEYNLDLSGIRTLIDEEVKMSIFYEKSNHSQDSIRSTAIPLQISFYFKVLELHFMFYAQEFIDSDKFQSEITAFGLNSEVMLDEFAFPTSFNCNRFLSENNGVNLFAGYELGAQMLSFVVESRTKLERFKHFVAFDGKAGSLRIDTKRLSVFEERERDYMQVIDFASNRKYIYVQTDQIQANQDATKQTESRCAVTYHTDPANIDQFEPSLSDLLLGSTKFVYMGRARIRGISALVYESSSKRYPFWHRQPLLYKNKNGDFNYRDQHVQVEDNGSVNEGKLFCVVVYVEENSASRRILQLDAFDMNSLRSQESRHQLTAQYSNFVWGLMDAPNGDRAEELFSLQELCSAGAGRDKYAEVDILLIEDKVPDGTNTVWIEDPSKRNEALMSSLRSELDIQTAFVYDLGSRLVSQKRHHIAATFRVAEHPHLIYNITFVGRAFLSSVNDHKRVEYGQSLLQCLRMVDDSKSYPTYVLYSEEAKSCVIDTSLEDKKPSLSQVYNILPNGAGELFRVDAKLDLEVGLKNSWLNGNHFRHLEGKTMFLKQTQSDNYSKPNKTNMVQMRIKNIKVESEHYMSRFVSRKRQIEAPKSIFPGFALLESSPENQQVALNDQDEHMSLDQCHAACLADINCKSFSYCAHFSQTQCIKSTVSFKIYGITEQLNDNKVQKLRRGSRLTVQLGFGAAIDLKRDFTCELRNMVYMDSFRRSSHSEKTLNWLEVSAVDSVEQCAELCIAKNIESIRSGLKLSEKIGDILRDKSGANGSVEALVSETYKNYRKSSHDFCSHFLYLDSSLSDEQAKIIQDYTNSDADFADGYCGLESESKKQSSDLNGTKFLFEIYLFDYNTLYAKNYGFGLKMASLSEEEHKANVAINHPSGNPSAEHYKIIARAINEGKNLQALFMGDEMGSNCAHSCFSQSSGLWPACRSFDIMITHYKANRPKYQCIFNTLANSSDIWKPEDKSLKYKAVEYWHCEPRFGLNLQDIESANYMEGEFISEERSTELKIGGFAAIVLAIAGIASGLALSVLIVRRFSKLARNSQDDVVKILQKP